MVVLVPAQVVYSP
jgi:hypothetical protein